MLFQKNNTFDVFLITRKAALVEQLFETTFQNIRTNFYKLTTNQRRSTEEIAPLFGTCFLRIYFLDYSCLSISRGLDPYICLTLQIPIKPLAMKCRTLNYFARLVRAIQQKTFYDISTPRRTFVFGLKNPLGGPFRVLKIASQLYMTMFRRYGYISLRNEKKTFYR